MELATFIRAVGRNKNAEQWSRLAPGMYVCGELVCCYLGKTMPIYFLRA